MSDAQYSAYEAKCATAAGLVAPNSYPAGAQTCVAMRYTCSAPAPNTPGNACVCQTNEGSPVQGVVR